MDTKSIDDPCSPVLFVVVSSISWAWTILSPMLSWVVTILIVLGLILLLPHVCCAVWLASLSNIVLLLLLAIVVSWALLYHRIGLILWAVLELTILSIIRCTISIVRLSITVLCSIILWCTVSVIELSALTWWHLLVAVLSIVGRHWLWILAISARHWLTVLVSHLLVLSWLLVVRIVVIRLLVLITMSNHWWSWFDVVRSWWIITLTYHKGRFWCASIILWASLKWCWSLSLSVLFLLLWLASSTHQEAHALFNFALFWSFTIKELIIFFLNIHTIDILLLVHYTLRWFYALWFIISILWNWKISIEIISAIVEWSLISHVIWMWSTEI